jgi:invasion protein IalB
MNIMTKIVIGTSVLAIMSAAIGLFIVDVPQGKAIAGKTIDASRGAPRPVTSGTGEGFDIAQAASPPASRQSALPGGATSLQESYQDWVVVCAQRAGATPQVVTKHCAMNQQQADQKNGQRVLALELAPSGSGFEAALFLPFGLMLDKGVTLQVDDGQPGGPFRFRTCLPAGCLVSLTFDDAYMTALQKGTSLKIKTVAEGGADTPFTVSLKGFGPASARLTSLAK